MDSLPQDPPPVKPLRPVKPLQLHTPDGWAMLVRAVWLIAAPPVTRQWGVGDLRFAMDVPAKDFRGDRQWHPADVDNAASMAAVLQVACAASGEGPGLLRRRLIWSLATALKCIAHHRRAHGLPRRGFVRIGRPVFLGGAR